MAIEPVFQVFERQDRDGEALTEIRCAIETPDGSLTGTLKVVFNMEGVDGNKYDLCKSCAVSFPSAASEVMEKKIRASFGEPNKALVRNGTIIYLLDHFWRLQVTRLLNEHDGNIEEVIEWLEFHLAHLLSTPLSLMGIWVTGPTNP